MATRDLTQQEIDVLPIDIHYNKLLDWLINRRHCKQQWSADSLCIREKINSAIEDMPAVSEITSLLEGAYINYFHCQEIVKLLKETESGNKNIFGQYSSQKLKDWLDIIKKYEADGVYLAEAAQILMRNVNYEIPALKKQIAKCQQVQRECTRKEGDYAVNAADLRKQYESKCHQMGIKGKKIKSELLSLVADLPTVFEEIARQTKTLELATTFYDDFINFTMKRENTQSESLSMLKLIGQRGNVTTYEWREGSAPSRIEDRTTVDTTDEQEQGIADEDIDWGNNGVDAAVDFGEEIDFGEANITIEGGGDAIVAEEVMNSTRQITWQDYRHTSI